jgi:small subunit ribosomal protein S17
MTSKASTTTGRGLRKRREGTVVSRSGDKSIVVLVERRLRHPVYGKVVRQRRRFHAHDEANAASVGDRVTIEESRPMSRLKRWRVASIDLRAGAGLNDGAGS